MNGQSGSKLILSFISRVLVPTCSFYSRLSIIASLALCFRFCLPSHHKHIKVMSNDLPSFMYSAMLLYVKIWMIACLRNQGQPFFSSPGRGLITTV